MISLKKKKRGLDQESADNLINNELDTAANSTLEPSTEQNNQKEENDPKEQINQKKQKKKKGIKGKIALVIFLFLFFVGCIYMVIAFHFQSHFLPGTTINGMNCESLTAAQVKEKLQNSIEKYSLSIVTADGSASTITGDMLGLVYSDDSSVDQLLQTQNPYLWFMNLIEKDHHSITANITYDKEFISMLLKKQDFMDESKQVAPTNAYIAETDTGWEIIPETYGNKINSEAFLEAVFHAIDNGTTELNLQELGLYEKPSILSTDASLKEQIDKLNTLTQANITYDFEDGRIYTVDRAVIKDWLVQAEDGTYSIDQEKAAAFVKQMAYDTDTFGLAHEFKTSLGPTITLARGGDYGWVINREATTANLIAEITLGTQGTLQPIYRYSGKARGINDIGGTYVEICIEKQKMWCYKDGKLVVETNVVTGNHSTGYDTPSGSVWAIDAKKKDVSFTLYDADVTFWLPFNDQVGIHDASWRSAGEYTETHYLTDGSHGCINTPYEAAEKIFNTVDIGYPVVVYYSTSQPVGPQPTQDNSVG